MICEAKKFVKKYLKHEIQMNIKRVKRKDN